ncbi:MAG: ABC transporter ATP-binding protein [Armatimonadota bacterium]|nr:ABC transporter ATP-binding protein [Armatimonadota bacterium]
MGIAIRTESLTKVYPLPRRRGARVAVNELTMDVMEGQVFAFLGPNGAGKTTTIKALLGFIRPTSGRAEIFGRDISIPEVRRDVGYLPEQPYFHKFLTPREALSLHAALLGLGRKERKAQIESALSITGLEEYQQVRVAKLSKGLMQRVGIAQALIGNPRLFILDEPTSGLDPIGRREMKDLILSLKNAGSTVFMSSHLLSEVEEICDQVAILSKGTLVCRGAPDEIKQTGDMMNVACARMTKEAAEQLILLGGQMSDGSEALGAAVVKVPANRVFDAIKTLEAHGLPLLGVSPERETLEDAFMRLAA